MRVVTYNVLSSSLCEEGRFPCNKKDDLDPKTRLRRVQGLLEAHMKVGAILCLQEVSSLWAAQLASFFSQRRYAVVSAMYHPGIFTGYMGNLLCWPADEYECVDANAVRCRDAKRWPKPARRAGVTEASWHEYMKANLEKIQAALDNGLQSLFDAYIEGDPAVDEPVHWVAQKLGKEKGRYDPWKEASERENALAMARLRSKADGREFCVASFHGPVAFANAAQVQFAVIQVALAAHALLDFANGLPCVLAGDFNQTPASAPYALLTTATLPASHQHRPPARTHDPWSFELPSPFTSAYAANRGSEPELTTMARMDHAFFRAPNPEPMQFADTIDYIFTHPGRPGSGPAWTVRGVRPLPSKAEAQRASGGSYPTADEPSDHLLIWADLELAAPVPSEARRLFDQHDANKDGALSLGEFASFAKAKQEEQDDMMGA